LPLLAHTVLPTTLPRALVRVLVAVTIGVGAATVAIAATRLRPRYEGRPPRDQESSMATPIFRSMYVEK
jgi:hypothetical protein